MAFPSTIEITTFQNGEISKVKSEGLVFFDNDSAFIEINSQTGNTRVGVSPGIVTITKLGEDSYTLVLEEGKSNGTIINAGAAGFEISILSGKSDLIKTDSFLDLLLRYTLCIQKTEIKTKVRIKCEYKIN